MAGRFLLNVRPYIAGLCLLATVLATPQLSNPNDPDPNGDKDPSTIPPDQLAEVQAYDKTNSDPALLQKSLLDLSEGAGSAANGGIDPHEGGCVSSHYCVWKPWFSGGVDMTSCKLAYEQFDSESYYGHYTSYVHGHCTAIFDCVRSNEFNGFKLKQEFDVIYQDFGCKRCGVHYFNGTTNHDDTKPWDCYAKLDYCWNCHQEGQPDIKPEPLAASAGSSAISQSVAAAANPTGNPAISPAVVPATEDGGPVAKRADDGNNLAAELAALEKSPPKLERASGFVLPDVLPDAVVPVSAKVKREADDEDCDE